MNDITAAEWTTLFELFEIFQKAAVKFDLCPDEIDLIEEALFISCPIPQPHKISV